MSHLDLNYKIDSSKFKDTPFTKRRRTGWEGIKMADNFVYNYKVRVNTPEMHQLHKDFATILYNAYKIQIERECKTLIDVWHKEIPRFFNRRAKGMYMYKAGNLRKPAWRTKELRKQETYFYFEKYGNSRILTKPQDLKIPSNLRQMKTWKNRGSSGRLKNALFIHEVTPHGAVFDVRELYVRGYDYVDVLIRGAHPKKYAPYIPKWDCRNKKAKGPNAYWGGISRTYWQAWDIAWRKHLRQSELKIQRRMEEVTQRYNAAFNKDKDKVYAGTYKKKQKQGEVEKLLEQEKKEHPREFDTGVFQPTSAKKWKNAKRTSSVTRSTKK